MLAALIGGAIQAADAAGALALEAYPVDTTVDGHTRNQQAIPKLIEAIDCGRAAVFLLSEASRIMTGQTIYLDGGMTSMIYPRDIMGDTI